MKKETYDYALKSTWQLVSNMYNKEAVKFESTMVIGFALLSIDQKGSSVTELGPKMGMESTSLSRLINTMEERKLIKRYKNPKDGRGVIIKLSKFGKLKREDSKSVVMGFNKEIDKNLNKEEIKNFYKVINRISEVAKKYEFFKKGEIILTTKKIK
ncbi:MAG: MarR family winged helix-turn-helix transcriptional regulator [Flavobacteriaceae bacterium]|tara:strand:- start:458 stop:925 length:468 start_codon:yes stop_codon:yes gene_type:complete